VAARLLAHRVFAQQGLPLVFLIGRFQREPFAIGLRIVAQRRVDSQGVLCVGVWCERGVRAIEGGEWEVFLAVEMDLDGQVGCVGEGVLRFLNIVEWPCRVLAILRPTTLPPVAAVALRLSMFKLLAVSHTEYIRSDPSINHTISTANKRA